MDAIPFDPWTLSYTYAYQPEPVGADRNDVCSGPVTRLDEVDESYKGSKRIL